MHIMPSYADSKQEKLLEKLLRYTIDNESIITVTLSIFTAYVDLAILMYEVHKDIKSNSS
jgi:hypothetical protein